MICFVETEANEFVGRDRQISGMGLFHKDYIMLLLEMSWEKKEEINSKRVLC